VVQLGECQDGAAIRCPVCSGAIAVPCNPAVVRWCRDCRTPHHWECWRYNDGCAVYGCDPRSCPLVIQEEELMPLESWGPAGHPLGPVAAMAAMAVIVLLCAILGH
jgi:hypothetical protein